MKKISLFRAVVLMTAFSFSAPVFADGFGCDGTVQVSKKTVVCTVASGAGYLCGGILSCFPCSAPCGYGILGFTAGADTVIGVQAAHRQCTGEQNMVQPAGIAAPAARIVLPPPTAPTMSRDTVQPPSV